MVKLQWVSWWQPTEDYRPLNFPPNQYILGWWKSGEDMEGNASLCALVIAMTEENAKRIIKVDWPEADNWRFCYEKEGTNLSDRFPVSEWMQERINDYNANAA